MERTHKANNSHSGQRNRNSTGCGKTTTAGWKWICGSLLAGGLVPATAADPAPEVAKAPAAGESQPAEAAEAPADKLFGPIKAWRQRLSDQGIDFQLTYTGEVIGSVHGGVRGGAIYEGLAKLGFDLDGEKLVGWKGGSFHVSGLYAHGASPSSHLAGDLLTLSNIDAYDSPRLFEVWFQQVLFDGRLSLRAGQLAADEEFATTEYAGLFVHGTTGWPGMIAANSPTPAYPTAAPGVRLEFKPTSNTFLRVGAFDGNPDPGNDLGEPVNRHGVRFNLGEGAFIISEAGIEWNHAAEAKGLPGNAKFGGWYHTDNFADQRIDDTGLSLADPGTSGVARNHSGNWGIYGSVEQLVYREEAGSPQGLAIFTRAGGSPSSVNTLGYYIEGGLHYQGLIPGRDDDIIGVAASYGRISSSLRGLTSDNNVLNGASDPLPDYELAVQGTYQIPLRAGWTVQPTVWWIRHPGGSSAVRDAVLAGVRTVLDF